MKTLLLDKIYQPVAFIGFKNLARKIAKDKVDIVSVWKDKYFIEDTKYPAIVKLKEYIRKRPLIPRFSRKGVFKRDKYICQYTGIKYSPSKLTIDHVIPKSQGGKNTWENCVTCSNQANSVKGDRTPEEAGMILLRKPAAPAHSLFIEFWSMSNPHLDWAAYFPDKPKN